MKPLELEDIQGILLSNYSRLPLARYIFLQWGNDRERAKVWLDSLAEDVTTAEQGVSQREGRPRSHGEAWPEQAVNIAFTASGLRGLGLSEAILKTFLQEFREGMACAHRQRILGDTGGSAPARWQFGGPSTEDIHLLLMLFTREGGATNQERWLRLEALYQRYRERYEAAGLKEVFLQDARMLPMGPGHQGFKEPFGFRLGISAPVIEGGPGAQVLPGQLPSPAGEFILGYRNSYGRMPFSPRVPDSLDAQALLEALPSKPGWKDLGRNGSYLVLRKLRQDVRGFWKFIREHSQDMPDVPEGDAHQEWLAAKLMGRWRSGAPLALCPVKDDPALGEDPRRADVFSYADDPHGMRCPITAHIRRSNPRDATLSGDPKKALRAVSRHLLLRRARPYHELCFEEPWRGEKGLVLIALNTDIRRQFEFIQQMWLNNRKFGGLRDERDPIVGNNRDPEEPGAASSSYAATLPALPVRQRLKGLPRFVCVRGGGYFFLPGIRALRFLGGRHPPSPAVGKRWPHYLRPL
jgi:Dyp-type peroxidase family